MHSSPCDAVRLSRSWAEHYFGDAPASGPLATAIGGFPAGLPFSCRIGGVPLAQVVRDWERRVCEEPSAPSTRRRVLTWADPRTAFEIRADVVCHTDTGGVEWTLHFTNRGAQDSPRLDQLQSVDVIIAPAAGGGEVRLHRLNGSTSTELDWLPIEDLLAPGAAVEFGPHGNQANSSSGACPFFNLQWPGGGVITALGWSAPWRARGERAADGAVRLQAGMDRLALVLRPGESIRTPRILQLYWAGDDPLAASNQFRAVMLAHVLPRQNGRLVLPPLAHTSVVFWEESDCTEQDVLAHLESVAGLGFEVFWLDAYWIRDGYPKGTGHYGFPIRRVEPPDRFPRGLRPIADAAHRAELEFLVWFSPEIVWAGGDLSRERHPWTRFWETDKPLYDWGQVDLGDAAAWQFMTDYLKTVIREYAIDWLRIDSGMIPAFADERDAAAPDRVGMAVIRYVEGLYRMWDELLATFPQLRIDNCFGGGRRIDLETCSRALPLWRTDFLNELARTGRLPQVSVLNQMMTAGLNRYVPFSLCTQLGASPYAFRSGFNAGITFSDDCRVPGYPREQLRAALAEARRIRRYCLGNFYPLLPVTNRPSDWCAMQYHLPAEQAGMVLVFRRHEAAGSEMALPLREIDPAAQYEVSGAADYAPAAPVRLAGTALQRFTAAISDCPGSLLIEYRRC